MFLIFSFATIHIFLKIRVPLSRIPLYSYAYLGISAFQYVSQPLTSLYTVVFSIASFIFAHLFYKQNDATIKAASNHSHFLSANAYAKLRFHCATPPACSIRQRSWHALWFHSFTGLLCYVAIHTLLYSNVIL